MCVTDRHDMTLAVKVALNPNTTNFYHAPHGRTLAPACDALVFSSPEHEVLRVSYCDHSPSVVRSHFLVYTLASTNINQSAPNLVKLYMTIISRMISILGLIGPERPELFALELNKCYISLSLHSSIYKYQAISTKLGQNIYDQ